MSKFKDSKGREYDVVLHVPMLKRIRQETGFDPFEVFSDNQEKILAALDPVRVSETVCIMAEASAVKQSVSRDEFLEMMSGDTLDAAANAMVDALISFYPNPRARKLFREAWENAKMIEAQMIEKAGEGSAATSSALSKSLSTATGSPVSSESSPTG